MIKAIMIMCWNKEGNNRIVAEEIVQILQQKGVNEEISQKVLTIGNYSTVHNVRKNYDSLHIQRSQYDGPPARISS